MPDNSSSLKMEILKLLDCLLVNHPSKHPSDLIWCFHLEHKQLLKNAQLELKKSKRKDYYKILGVDKTASEDEIKKAYRKRALMHHPGKAESIHCPNSSLQV